MIIKKFGEKKGEIRRYKGKLIYETYRKSNVHYYIKGGGYPISNSILKICKEQKVEDVIIIEETKSFGKRKWKVPLKEYLTAVLIQEGDFDKQRCLPLKKMELIKNA